LSACLAQLVALGQDTNVITTAFTMPVMFESNRHASRIIDVAPDATYLSKYVW
jgi:hypothetical protein